MRKLAYLLVVIVFIFSCDIFNEEKEEEKKTEVDSDGDGYTDDQEINLYKHSMDVNPLKFNPLIADLPGISFDLTAVPRILLISEDSTVDISTTETSISNTSGSSLSNSHTSSIATTESHTMGVEVSAEASWDGGSVTVTGSYEETKTTEVSSSNTSEVREDRSRTLQDFYALETQKQNTITGGKLVVSLKIINTGNIAYTLRSMTLIAYTFDPYSGAYKPIGTLETDGESGFQPQTLKVGESKPMIFSLETTTREALGLLSANGSIVIKPSTYEIVDENDVSFAHNDTLVSASTFSLMIDYGPKHGVPTEYYRISDSSNNDSLDKVFKNILGTTNFSSNETGLRKFRDLEVDDTANGGWMIVHTYNEDGKNKKKYYHPFKSYSIEDIKPVRGDSVLVMYFEDRDGDGLFSGEEFIYGTSDNDADSDDDGLNDKEEVEVGAIPLIKDSDRDGLLDGDDETPVAATPPEKLNISRSQQFTFNWETNETKRYDKVHVLISDIEFDESFNNLEAIPQETNNLKVITLDSTYLENNSSYSDPLYILSKKYNSYYYYKFVTENLTINKFTSSGTITVLTDTKMKVEITYMFFDNIEAEGGNEKSEFSWYLTMEGPERQNHGYFNTRYQGLINDRITVPPPKSDVDVSGFNKIDKYYARGVDNSLTDYRDYYLHGEVREVDDNWNDFTYIIANYHVKIEPRLSFFSNTIYGPVYGVSGSIDNNLTMEEVVDGMYPFEVRIDDWERDYNSRVGFVGINYRISFPKDFILQ